MRLPGMRCARALRRQAVAVATEFARRQTPSQARMTPAAVLVVS